MTHKLLRRLGLLLGAAALPVMAGEDPATYYVSAGWVSSQGDLRELTNSAAGYGGEVGIRLESADFGLMMIGHAGFIVTPQKDKVAGQYTAKAPHFGFGLGYRLGELPAFIEAGVVMHSWNVKNVYVVPTDALGEKNWKLGGRVVLNYDITRNWGASVGYTFSEWQAGANPSYATVSAFYRF